MSDKNMLIEKAKQLNDSRQSIPEPLKNLQNLFSWSEEYKRRISLAKGVDYNDLTVAALNKQYEGVQEEIRVLRNSIYGEKMRSKKD